MFLGLYAFGEDDFEDVACIDRWVSWGMDQIVKEGDLFKVGLVVGFIFGFVDHLDSDKFIIYDHLTELIIF